MTEEELAKLEPYEPESMFYGNVELDRAFRAVFGSDSSKDSADTNNSEAKA